MNPKALVVALVGIGCVGAAGVGAFLAVRSATPAPIAATALVAPALDTAGSDPAAPGSAATPVPVPPVRVGSAPQPSSRTVGVPAASASEAPTSRPTAVPEARSDAPSLPPPTTIDLSPASPVTPDAPAARPVDELVVLADSVIGIRMDSAVSSESARLEDRVTAHVTRDVRIDGRTAIPAGAQLEGTVTAVDRGGKVRGRARVGIRFSMLVLNDRERLSIQTDTIYRESDAPTNQASAKIGASAVVGSILGAVIGGKKGAAIGGAAGAAGGTAAVMAGDRSEASIATGTPLTVRMTAPVTVPVTRED